MSIFTGKVLGVWNRFKHDFDLSRASPIYFWKAEWEIRATAPSRTRVSQFYIGYRLIFLLYFFCFTFYDLWQYPDIHRFPIYFTNWTLILLNFYAIFYFCRLLFVFIDQSYADYTNMNYFDPRNKHADRLEWPEKFIWIMFNMISTFCYMVAWVYWIFLYMQPTAEYYKTTSKVLHATVAVMAFIGNFFVAIPVRVTHAIFPMAFGVIYSIFTFVYYKVSSIYYPEDAGTIYPFMEWKDAPWRTLGICVAAVSMGGVFHFWWCWGSYKFRRGIKRWVYGKPMDICEEALTFRVISVPCFADIQIQGPVITKNKDNKQNEMSLKEEDESIMSPSISTMTGSSGESESISISTTTINDHYH